MNENEPVTTIIETNNTIEKKIPTPPPIILKSTDWHKIAPTIYNNEKIPLDNTTTKDSTDGKVLIKAQNLTIFRIIQHIFQKEDIFHSQPS